MLRMTIDKLKSSLMMVRCNLDLRLLLRKKKVIQRTNNLLFNSLFYSSKFLMQTKKDLTIPTSISGSKPNLILLSTLTSSRHPLKSRETK